MVREAMESARDLIRAKQYREARQLLKTIDHPKAEEWLAKLNEIAPEEEDDFADILFPEASKSQKKAKRKPTSAKAFSANPLYIALASAGGVILLLLIVIVAMTLRPTQTEAVVASLPTQANLPIQVTQAPSEFELLSTQIAQTRVVAASLIDATNQAATTQALQRPTLPPTYTPTDKPRPTATPDEIQAFYDEYGTGKKSDPYRYQTTKDGTFALGITNDSLIGVAGYLTSMDSVIQTWNMFNTEPEFNQEYIGVILVVQCEAENDSTCDYSALNFQVVGSKGKVYDAEWVTGNPLELADEVYSGGQATGQIMFIVDKDDDNFLLIYKPNMFGDEAYFFEMQETYID